LPDQAASFLLAGYIFRTTKGAWEKQERITGINNGCTYAVFETLVLLLKETS
jgi:hypothetical protein